MNRTLLRAWAAFVPASALLLWSVFVFVRTRTVGSAVQLLGAGCLLVVVFAHVCEGLHLFPAMRWGEPDSVGHYVDLVSAVAGVTLVAVGVLLRVVRSRSSPL